MSIAAEQIREAFPQLPEGEQKQLAQEFWEQTEFGFRLTAEQKQIVLDELEAHRRAPSTAITWAALRARLEAHTNGC